MEDLEIVIECRYNKKCRYIEDGKIHQCNAYLKVEGVHPGTGEKVDRWECADSLIPLLLIENAQTNRGQTQAICSLREETIKRQDAAIIAMLKGGENARFIDSQ